MYPEKDFVFEDVVERYCKKNDLLYWEGNKEERKQWLRLMLAELIEQIGDVSNIEELYEKLIQE